MKTGIILFLISFTLLSFVGRAQVGTFSRVYSGSSYDEGIKSFHLADHTYRIVGNTGSYGWGQTNIWLIALDSAGNFLWHKTYGKGSFDKAENATIDSQGNIYVIGTSSSQAQMSFQMMFLGIDKGGNAFTTSYIGGSDWDFGYGIKLISDTSFLIVGQTYNSTHGQADARVLEVDKQGNINWAKTVGGKLKEVFYGVDRLANGDIVCCGMTQSYGNGSFDPCLCRLTANGDSLWFKSLPDSTDGGFYDLIINADTDIVAVGFQEDTAFQLMDLSVMAFHNNGDLFWDRISLRQRKYAYYKSIVAEGNKYVVAGMSTRYGSGGQNIYGSKLRHDGWWQSSFVFGGNKDDYAYSITKDTVGGYHYLVTGTTRSYGLSFSGAILIRMDSAFHADTVVQITIPSDINTNTESAENTILIAPNPILDKLLISNIKNKQNVPMYIDVYDTYGRLFYTNEIQDLSNRIEINASTWPLGPLFVVVRSGNTVFKTTILHI